MELAKLYEAKPGGYFDLNRAEIVQRVPSGPNSVLDIGCGMGNVGRALKEQSRAQEVVGVELSESAAEVARTRLDQVLVGNVEVLALPFESERFDIIILADVLEHLLDPWALMGRLAALLKPGGRMIASIPNVRSLKVLAPLIFKGQWDYRDWGLLDRAHVRFFTEDTARRLFLEAGLDIAESAPLLPWHTKSGKLNRLTLGLLEGFIAAHYLIVAIKLPRPR